MELCRVWRIFLGVLAMLRSSCRTWLYTSREQVKSGGTWLLRNRHTYTMVRGGSLRVVAEKRFIRFYYFAPDGLL